MTRSSKSLQEVLRLYEEMYDEHPSFSLSSSQTSSEASLQGSVFNAPPQQHSYFQNIWDWFVSYL
jgi:hypothetical protein